MSCQHSYGGSQLPGTSNSGDLMFFFFFSWHLCMYTHTHILKKKSLPEFGKASGNGFIDCGKFRHRFWVFEHSDI